MKDQMETWTYSKPQVEEVNMLYFYSNFKKTLFCFVWFVVCLFSWRVVDLPWCWSVVPRTSWMTWPNPWVSVHTLCWVHLVGVCLIPPHHGNYQTKKTELVSYQVQNLSHTWSVEKQYCQGLKAWPSPNVWFLCAVANGADCFASLVPVETV